MFSCGDKVFDNKINSFVMIEKIDDAGFIVLDTTFGKSTQPHKRTQWLKQHIDDGRYSLSFDEFKNRIKTKKKYII